MGFTTRSRVMLGCQQITAVFGIVACALSLPAATLTIQTNRLGSTPSILGFNSGHFYPGSNTRDWWRYSGVNGARVFLSPSEIEPSDDHAPVGDGVNSAASFLARRAAIRTNQFNPAYINWASFSNRYESNDLYPNNHIRPNYAFGELRHLGIQICAQITASQSRLPVADTNDWANIWELWQHYYVQAFYLGRVFDVEHYQMYNEPNHPNANGLTITNYLLRLQLASDAIQAALVDVNSLYGKSLTARILAPVTSGSADGSYPGWGESVVTNRHRNFLNQLDPGFSLFHVYDYHQYNSTPASFGVDLSDLNSLLSADMSPEVRPPTAISEFNTHAGATFDTMTETLDSPTEYPRLGAICVNLMSAGCDELYCFKFSQTEYTGNYPVAKNALHYVDNGNSPYNVGGITQAGEVWRLFNQAFAAGRDRLGVAKDAGAASLDVSASYDPAAHRYHAFSVNNTSSGVPLDVDLRALNAVANRRFWIEELSESSHGGIRLWGGLSTNQIVSATQPANSVWLLSVSTNFPQSEISVPASDDAEVRDGANQGNNYGALGTMTVRNDPTNAANRSVAFLKFNLPTNSLAKLEFAALSLTAASAGFNTLSQAHVYGLVNRNWSQATLNWNTAPNLKTNMPAGATIADGFVTGQGTNAFIVGQLVTSSTAASEKLINVTAWLRGQTGSSVTFLIAQEPRWDVTLPSLAVGDTQPDGLKILTTESGNAPQLRLVFNQTGNSPPTAMNDIVTTTQNVAVVINVLTNDSDADGDLLALQSFTQGANGNVRSNADQNLTYTPNSTFSGVDNFTYVITDGHGGSAGASVNVTVVSTNPPPAQSWTNIAETAEAFVRGGASAALDQDEVATGYIMVKYNPSPFDTARKAYFQFDLTGLNVNLDTQAAFTVVTHTQDFTHRAQLWGLNQGYPDFNPGITWNNAQANDTASNVLLANGPFTATTLGGSVLIPSTPSAPYSFTLPRLGDFVFDHRITLVLSGVNDAANDPGGLRLARRSATLQVSAFAIPAVNPTAPLITGISNNGNGTVTLRFLGRPGQNYRLLTASNVTLQPWAEVSSNIADADGEWSVTDSMTDAASRYYRAVTP